MLSHDYYDYEELKAKAKSPNATPQDRLALLVWFWHYDINEWNGESFPLENGERIFPVYQPVGNPDEDGDYEDYELVDAEVR